MVNLLFLGEKFLSILSTALSWYRRSAYAVPTLRASGTAWQSNSLSARRTPSGRPRPLKGGRHGHQEGDNAPAAEGGELGNVQFLAHFDS